MRLIVSAVTRFRTPISVGGPGWRGNLPRDTANGPAVLEESPHADFTRTRLGRYDLHSRYYVQVIGHEATFHEKRHRHLNTVVLSLCFGVAV
jgi:hypothetical protein